MAKEQENNQEPSIEEILDSIRQIISDDDESGGEGSGGGGKPAPEEEVIELTEKLPEPGPIEVDMKEVEEQAVAAVAPPPPPPVPEPPPVAAAPKPPPPSPPAPKPEPRKPDVDFSDTSSDLDSLLTRNAEDSVMGAFTELSKRAAINRGAGVTVEDVVREEVRPMLKQWLDKNLPALVERLVQAEMERISKRILGDE